MGNVPKKEPKVDELVSKAVGKTIYTTNLVLIKKLAEWKQAKKDPDAPDNFLEDENKINELKAIL